MMQPAGAAKKYIHKHAIRDIIITYADGKSTMTSEDKELLNAYIILHNLEVQINAAADTMRRGFAEINKRVEVLHKELKELKIMYNSCRLTADKLSENINTISDTAIKNLTASQAHACGVIENHHKLMEQLYHDLQPYEEMLVNYFKDDDEEALTCYNAFRDVNSRHTSNYEKNAIDIVDFDNEYERFLACKDANDERRNNIADNCDTAVAEYNALNLETNNFYDLWSEFSKRCDLLVAVFLLHSEKF